MTTATRPGSTVDGSPIYGHSRWVLSRGAVTAFGIDGAVALRGLLDRTWIEARRRAGPELLDGSCDPIARMTSDKRRG